MNKEKWLEHYNKLDKSNRIIVKSKGGLSYLGWNFAVKYCRENDIDYKEEMITDLLDKGVVGIKLTIEDNTYIEYLAITNNRNQAIKSEDISGTDIANTYKRCLAKAIASATGYGFALYTDELVESLKDTKPTTKPVPKISKELQTEILELIGKTGVDMLGIMEQSKVDNIGQLTLLQANKLKAALIKKDVDNTNKEKN